MVDKNPLVLHFSLGLSAKHRAKRSAPDQMQVNMVDLLSAMGIAIHDQSIAFIRNTMLSGQLTCHRKQPAKRRFMYRQLLWTAQAEGAPLRFPLKENSSHTHALNHGLLAEDKV